MLQYTTVACAVALAACAGGSAPATPAAVPEPAPTVLYEPGSTEYLIVSHGTQEQDFQGQIQSTSTSMRVQLRVDIAASAEGMTATFTVDSILEANAPGIFSSQRNQVTGSTLTASLTPTGELGEVTTTSENELARQIANTVRLFFPRLPAGGAEPGATWTDTTETLLPTGQVDLTLRAITQYTAADWIDHDGARALPIAVAAAVTISGQGEQMGAEFTLQGDGTTTGTLYLSATGTYLGGVSSGSVSALVDVEVAGLTIPVTMIEADTVSVIR